MYACVHICIYIHTHVHTHVQSHTMAVPLGGNGRAGRYINSLLLWTVNHLINTSKTPKWFYRSPKYDEGWVVLPIPEGPWGMKPSVLKSELFWANQDLVHITCETQNKSNKAQYTSVKQWLLPDSNLNGVGLPRATQTLPQSTPTLLPTRPQAPVPIKSSGPSQQLYLGLVWWQWTYKHMCPSRLSVSLKALKDCH